MEPDMGLVVHGAERPKCGARTRPGAKHPTCQHEPGWGTDHPGEGKCKFHGGASPVKHGLYSKIHRTPLGVLAEQHRKNPDPTNLEHELAYLRAAFEDWGQRFEKGEAEIGAGIVVLDRIGTMVERIERIRSMDVISKLELMRVMRLMAEVVKEHVPDEATQRKIHEGWGKVLLAAS
jgi:hypothetical protein